MDIAGFDINHLIDIYLIPWGIKIVTALAVFIIGRWIAKKLVSVLKKVMAKGSVDEMLSAFIGNIVYALLLVVIVLAALEQLGVNTTSALAILGAAGLAVGLALQSSLSNFAAGVMLIMFRPFQKGDFVEAAGQSGVVEEVQIFNTTMKTGDNRQIIIPNGQIYGGTIVNYSAKDTRRIDLVIGIGYDDDIAKAKEILADLMVQENRILADPAPAIALGELGDSSVNFNVRPWVASGDYWPVRGDLLERIKLAFDAAGISIPYPQQDVHMYEEKKIA